jgi:uncharacterized protein
MRFKINEIDAEGLVLDVPVPADWMAAACPDVEARPGPSGLALKGRLDKAGDDYLLRASLRGVLEMTCARCLEAAMLSIDVPVSVTFVSADADHTDDEEDPDIIAFQGGEIDVGDEIRDEILLAIPINVVCRETCAGLCPTCGVNRNASACGCKADRAATGAFAALADLGRSSS